jgi:hypothetical protein
LYQLRGDGHRQNAEKSCGSTGGGSQDPRANRGVRATYEAHDGLRGSALGAMTRRLRSEGVSRKGGIGPGFDDALFKIPAGVLWSARVE